MLWRVHTLSCPAWSHDSRARFLGWLKPPILANTWQQVPAFPSRSLHMWIRVSYIPEASHPRPQGPGFETESSRRRLDSPGTVGAQILNLDNYRLTQWLPPFTPTALFNSTFQTSKYFWKEYVRRIETIPVLFSQYCLLLFKLTTVPISSA